MKNYLKYCTIGVGILFASCMDTLDTQPAANFGSDEIFNNKTNAEAFMNGVYASLMDDVLYTKYRSSNSGIAWESRTPNSVMCDQVGDGIDGVATELGITPNSDFGPNRFGLLRKCNLVIENVAASSGIAEADKTSLIAQARLVRGIVFFDQARKMGRFVPMTKVLTIEKPEEANISMTKNVAESYKYIIDDLKFAADNLPATNQPGYPTKWAAKVILTRAALQAYAYTQDEQYLDLVITTGDDVKANCGIALNNSDGKFNEYDEYNEEIFWAYYRDKENTKLMDFSELVGTIPNIAADDVKNSKSPVALQNKKGRTFESWATHFPTQDLVDQFLVIDDETGKALPWDQTSQYKNNVDELDPASVTTAGQVDSYAQVNGNLRRIPTPIDLTGAKDGYPLFKKYAKLKSSSTRHLSDIMYKNRDKRFYYTVVYDGATWYNESIETNLGGNMSQGVRDKEDGGWYNTVTGYYWRKHSVEQAEPRASAGSNVKPHFVLARLGELYMNLAEAYLLKGGASLPKAVEALNETRTVHGGLPASTATTEEEIWKDYIRERNCEMTNENGDIYFSYLRWGKYGGHANQGRSAGDVIVALDSPAYKIEISRSRDQLLIGQVTLQGSANRNFTTKRYLLPIQKNFLDVRESYGLDYEQNPGW